MRLRELKYPIAVLHADALWGGKNASLHSPRRWNNNDAAYYLGGGFDDANIFDAAGKVYEVERILLKKPNLLSSLVSRVTTLEGPSGSADVDMELRQTGELSLDGFCRNLREIALSHPSWWKRHSDQAEIEGMFDGCATFADAINSIGVLDPPGNKQPKGKSKKVADLRY